MQQIWTICWESEPRANLSSKWRSIKYFIYSFLYICSSLVFTDFKNWPFLLNLIETCQTLAGTEKDVKKKNSNSVSNNKNCIIKKIIILMLRFYLFIFPFFHIILFHISNIVIFPCVLFITQMCHLLLNYWIVRICFVKFASLWVKKDKKKKKIEQITN